MKSFGVLEEILNYIEQHLMDEIDLEEMAKIHFVSLSYLHKLFSSITGYSLKEYISKRRLSKAAYDLVNTEETIFNVAIKYQYNSYEVFSRAFKKIFNQPPSRYRHNRMFTEIFPKLKIEFIKNRGGNLMIPVMKIADYEKNDEHTNEMNYIICIDIDHFASYNDKYGRAGGDIVLAEAAHRIEKNILENMTFHREGGDEFVIMTHTTDLEKVKLVAEKIIEAADEKVIINNQEVTFQMSLGIGRMANNEASKALLSAKHAGRNCYKC